MFGIFKKKDVPPPSEQLTDDELDRVHGGAWLNAPDAVPPPDAGASPFGGSDAVAAVVGRSDGGCSVR